MPDDPTALDLAALVQSSVDAWNAGGVDAGIAYYREDATWQSAGDGLANTQRLKGRPAIRAFFQEFTGALEDFTMELEECRVLDNKVTVSRLVLRGRPRGSNGFIDFRWASVTIWTDGHIEQSFGYTDFDQARAAAERLSQEEA